MSKQLHISSLFSALALVCLALVARAGADGELRLDGNGPVVMSVEQDD